MIQKLENMDLMHSPLPLEILFEDPHLRTMTLPIPFFHHSKVTLDGTDMFWQDSISASEGFRLWLSLITQTHTRVSSLSRCSQQQTCQKKRQTPNAKHHKHQVLTLPQGKF
jgi:hypothetical protein